MSIVQRIINRVLNDTVRHPPTRMVAIAVLTVPVVFTLLWCSVVAITAGTKPTAQRTDATKKHITATPDAALDSLRLEDASLRSRMKIGRSDSISLVIDLKDRVVILTARGVPIKRIPVVKHSVSSAISEIQKDGSAAAWIRTPFTLKRDAASIERTPVRIKYAPKDTNEANKQVDEPEPLEKQDSYLVLTFSRSLEVRISQTEPPAWFAVNSYTTFAMRQLLKDTGTRIRRGVQRQSAADQYRINIRIPRDDATAIYRAMPDSLQMALRL